MRIAQIIARDASMYERRSQNLDFEALRAAHDVVVVDGRDARASRFDVVHIYGSPDAERSNLRALRTPYVAPSRPQKRLLWFLNPADPASVITPLKETSETFIPEAVDDAYFEAAADRPLAPGVRARIGSFGRPAVATIVEQTGSRLRRFREDIDWVVFDAAPAAAAMVSLSAWIDPAVRDDDFDGFVAEAIAAGVTPVAARTPINSQRLERGRTGFLVPPGDPNELTHAILAALFKPEAAREREVAARQTASKFRVRQRARALLALYENLTR